MAGADPDSERNELLLSNGTPDSGPAHPSPDAPAEGAPPLDTLLDGSGDRKPKRKRVEPVRLEQETLAAFTEYIDRAEAELASSLAPDGAFLWCESNAKCSQLLQDGRTVAQYWSGDQPTPVHKGLIHDWIGATFIRGATIERTLRILQDYDRHGEIYRPQVMTSKILSRSGDVFEVYMRLLKKRLITVVLDTEHHVEYSPVNEKRWQCRSHTVRISEVENAGKASEYSRLPDHGYGFLWRLVSYWRFEERDSGVIVECRAVSLTRDVPAAFRWAIGPMVKRLPRDSLTATLDATRDWVSGMLSA